jgi:GTP-binding protein
LLDCRERPRYHASDGRAGSGNRRSGKDGDDLVIHLPPGTVVKDADTGVVLIDLVEPGTRWMAAQGGRGGRGNARFATPTRQAPRRADPGEPGQERTLELELKLIADVGLVGLPNAGKSTLLARISRARPRTGPYPFTTLEPNLGWVELSDHRRFSVADLPGLVEGAHLGKGLGLEFLRHVERTRMLVLMVDVASESPGRDLELVERELECYSPALRAKPRLVLLTKGDLLPPERRADAPERVGLPQALLVSAQSGFGMEGMLEAMWERVRAEIPVAPREVPEGFRDE